MTDIRYVSFVPGMELIIEAFEAFQLVLEFLFRENQSCDSEVIGSVSLSKPTTGNKGNACVFQNF